MAVRRRRTRFYRISELREFKQKKNEEISGVAISYDKTGEQLVSYEFCEQSNAEEDQNTPEGEEEQSIEDGQSETKEFKAQSGKSIKRIVIRRTKYVRNATSICYLQCMPLTTF